MGKKFEVEKRAVVGVDEVEKIARFLEGKAKLTTTFKRFSVIFWNHPEAKPAEAATHDFRIRITGNRGLFTLKYGDWRGGGREEYEFHFDPAELDSVVNIMRVWGYKWGTTTQVERRKYDYRGMEIVLDRYLDDGSGLVEIEAQCRKESDFEKAEGKIDRLMEEWGLKPLTREGMVEFVNRLNEKKENYFDISAGQTGKYVRRWLKMIRGK